MNEQLDFFSNPLPDLKTVSIVRKSNPVCSKVAGRNHQLISQRGKCWQIYLLVKSNPDLTFSEIWDKFQIELMENKFENRVDVSRQLYVLSKKNIIKRIEPGRVCSTSGRLCATWKIIKTIVPNSTIKKG